MKNRAIEYPLLVEYLDVSNASVLSLEEERKIDNIFDQMCPMTTWGKVDWNHFIQKLQVGPHPENVIPSLELFLGRDFNKEVYVTYDTYIPVIQTTLNDVVRNFIEIIRISSVKFIFNPTVGYVIEIRNLSNITVGIFPTYDKFLQKEMYVDPDILQHNAVFKKCVEAINTTLLSAAEEKAIDMWFRKHVPFTKWGRIDWDLFGGMRVGYEPKVIKRCVSAILNLKGPMEKIAYVAWSEIGIPVIKTNLDQIIGNFDLIAPVSFQKFIFNPDLGYVIEILDNRRVTIGLVQ